MKIGDRVICRNTEGGRPVGIEKGKVYTIIGTGTCECGKSVIYLKEPTPIGKRCFSSTNPHLVTDTSYYAYRFEKVIDKWVENVCEESVTVQGVSII